MQAVTTLPKQQRARRLPAEQRQREILEAAVAVFAERGYAGTGTADIAAAAGIGEPTIYRYFANKRELYLAALRLSGEQVMENWQRIAAENEDPLNALLILGQWYHQTLRERPEILKLRFRSITEGHDTEVAIRAREIYRELMSFIEGLFEDARAQGRLSPDTDTKTMMWLFMAVGSLLDMTHLLGLQDELGPRELVNIGRVILEGRQ
jgi:AcrR family transcriptional regulator